ncbi:MAG: PqqD family protein [Ruminococcus sp.]|nr:PqqD family protein [Ruminococcus sp.]MDD5889073.1 PqqD family protein [Ruminococcus sp.]
MKVKEDFLLREVAGCYVVVPVGKATVDFNGMLNLNDTGAFLWERLQQETTKEELLKAMLDEYEVTEDIAKKDIDNFITKLKDGNLLE